MKLVIATLNQHKIKEFKEILGDRFEVLSAADVGFFEDVEETGSTFLENSLIKAKAVYDFCHLPSVADDSGLEVDCLGGRPGVFSARYSGGHGNDEANINKLLGELLNAADRSAHFTTAITYVSDEKIISVEGKTYGEILFERKGSGGFGYDPIFLSHDLKKSFGEATAEEKNSISHRKRAIEALLKELKNG